MEGKREKLVDSLCRGIILKDYRFPFRWDKIEKFYNEEFDPGSG